MDIVGDRKFVEIPGDRTHELPPLLVNPAHRLKRLDKVVNLAADIVESEEMIASVPAGDPLGADDLERRRMDLALNLADQYMGLVVHWRWGDSILEWIRQCEITFESRPDLRPLLRGDIWPHAGRSSFVTLLEDKAVDTEGVALERAVGLRLSFRHPPPISCCTNQFLIYLNQTAATSAYKTWADLNPAPVSSLPPERFRVAVVNMAM